MKPKEYFDLVLAMLTPEAARSDVRLYAETCGGAFVNNFREGRILTITERLQWLHSKMNERRLGRWGSVTLAGLFPKDAKMIESLNPYKLPNVK